MSEFEQKNYTNDQSKQYTTIINGYEIYEILGKGSFGEVFKAKKDGKVYAIKLLDYEIIKQRKLEKFVANEINLMRQTNHSNVVKIYDAFQTKNVIFLVLEYCNQGTLLSYISKQKPNVQQCVNLFIQVLAGVKSIHEQGILHRDLKLENIFIHDGVLKIADFGLAQLEQDDFIYCGTKFYMAPEILEKQQASYKSDLWSLGVILFTMIFRTLPFQSKDDLIQVIKSQTDPCFKIRKFFQGKVNFITMINSDIEDFFQKVFVFDMDKRIEFKELFNLPLITRQMKQEDKRESFIFYSKLDALCIGEIQQDKKLSSNISTVIQQQTNVHSETNKLLQELSVNQLNRIQEKTDSTKQSTPSTNSNLLIVQASAIQITYSVQQCEDILEDESFNQQNIYPSYNQSNFKKSNHCIQTPRALELNQRLRNTEILQSVQSVQQLRLDYSMLEKLTPKIQSNIDILMPKFQSDLEGIQNVVNSSKQEIISSNINKTQLCSSIKISILSFITDEFPQNTQQKLRNLSFKFFYF